PMFQIEDLRCEYQINPIGIGVSRPRIGWRLVAEERGILQSAYQIQVAEDDAFESLLWDSGKVLSDRSNHIELTEVPALSGKRYFYRVMAWNQRDEASAWSNSAYWETGLLGKDE